MVKLMFQAWRIMKREKPDYLITTGALITYPFCLVAKWKKVKVIYIESFARMDEPSLTGRLVYPIADLFLVQWEEMIKYYPKAIFAGGVF
jgi:UDP-N-acetylglucosamine:LPS N-acetylglucosamine transferase